MQVVESVVERKQYRTCEYCGKPFELTPQINRSDRVYCSDNCRVKAYQRRRKQAIAHGGGRRRVALQDHHRITESPDGLLALDEALTQFAAEEPAKAELVKLRFFAGMSTPEAASALGISVATAERWWVYARTWLFGQLQADTGQGILPTP